MLLSTSSQLIRSFEWSGGDDKAHLRVSFDIQWELYQRKDRGVAHRGGRTVPLSRRTSSFETVPPLCKGAGGAVATKISPCVVRDRARKTSILRPNSRQRPYAWGNIQ